MKRFLLSLIIGILALGLIVCDNNDNGNGNGDDNTHSHSYGEFKYNDKQHWKECSCGDKSELSNHSYSSNWSNNSTQHWKECVCGSKSDVSNHNENPCTVCEYEVIPMFFYGNYIPETQVVAGVSISAVFNLDELVANRNNARRRATLTPAAPPNPHNNAIYNQDNTLYGVYNSSGGKEEASTLTKTEGTLRWQEIKFSENAVKVNKDVTWGPNQLGFRFFAYPKSFGMLAGITLIATGDAMIGEYTQDEFIADGIEYYAYRTNDGAALTGGLSTSIHRFEFN